MFIIFSCSFTLMKYVMPVSLSSLLKGSLQARLSGKIMWRVYSKASRTPKREQAGDLHLCQSKEGFFLCSPSVQLSPPFHKYPCSPELAPNLVCFSFGSIILGVFPMQAAPFLSSRRKPPLPASVCVREVAWLAQLFHMPFLKELP